jgi:hypothetical protein
MHHPICPDLISGRHSSLLPPIGAFRRFLPRRMSRFCHYLMAKSSLRALNFLGRLLRSLLAEPARRKLSRASGYGVSTRGTVT